MAKKADASPSFEESMAQLEKIVEEIASGSIGLEESLARYEQGMQLVQKCKAVLERAEKRIEQLAAQGSGLVAQPLEAPEPHAVDATP